MYKLAKQSLNAYIFVYQLKMLLIVKTKLLKNRKIQKQLLYY